MKKAIWAAVLAFVSCAIVLGWRWYQNLAPDLENIFTVDPTRYETTYALQEFRLKPHDRQWVLKAITYYDENGTVQREENYQFDENGQSYYIAPNGNRIDAENLSWESLANLYRPDASWGTTYTEYDDAGRAIYREVHAYKASWETEMKWMYYRTDCPEMTGTDALSTVLTVMQTTLSPEEETWMRDLEGNPLWESVSYSIYNFDVYGNATELWIQEPYYVMTDMQGYLKAIIKQDPIWYTILRVDQLGRPLWLASYSCKDRQLTGYTIWEYEELE